MKFQVLSHKNDLQVTLTCGGFALAMGGGFIIVCAASQVLIDHSISIRVYM